MIKRLKGLGISLFAVGVLSCSSETISSPQIEPPPSPTPMIIELQDISEPEIKFLSYEITDKQKVSDILSSHGYEIDNVRKTYLGFIPAFFVSLVGIRGNVGIDIDLAYIKNHSDAVIDSGKSPNSFMIYRTGTKTDIFWDYDQDSIAELHVSKSGSRPALVSIKDLIGLDMIGYAEMDDSYLLLFRNSDGTIMSYDFRKLERF